MQRVGRRLANRTRLPGGLPRDPTVLVTTSDPAAVRERLAEVHLPATQEHHQALLELLRPQTTIDAAHLVLLAEAVAGPANHIVIHDGRTVRTYAARGEGEFAGVLDTLLTEGADKLASVDRHWFGELVGLTQSDATLRALADRFLPSLDDGSEGALLEILGGMPGSPARVPFLIGYMAPKGQLDGPRAWSIVGKLSFDEERLAMIRTLAGRPLAIDGSRLLATMKTLSFDDARTTGLRLLATRAKPVSAEVGRSVVATFSFDAGRKAALATLAKDGELQVDDAQLTDFTRLCSFDDARLHCVRTLAPHVAGTATGEQARALLQAFSFDSDRLAAMKVMASRWRSLPVESRQSLVAAFSFASEREKASRLLMH